MENSSLAPGSAAAQSPHPVCPSCASSGRDDGDGGQDGTFECNICLDTARDAVISLCGHLFCWPCLHQWLETRPNRQVCPVCTAGVNRDKVIPLYGRGSTAGQQDPRDKTPPRPQGLRPEPESQGGYQGFAFGEVQMSFGISAIPFPDGTNHPDAHGGSPRLAFRQRDSGFSDRRDSGFGDRRDSWGPPLRHVEQCGMHMPPWGPGHGTHARRPPRRAHAHAWQRDTPDAPQRRHTPPHDMSSEEDML